MAGLCLLIGAALIPRGLTTADGSARVRVRSARCVGDRVLQKTTIWGEDGIGQHTIPGVIPKPFFGGVGVDLDPYLGCWIGHSTGPASYCLITQR